MTTRSIADSLAEERETLRNIIAALRGANAGQRTQQFRFLVDMLRRHATRALDLAGQGASLQFAVEWQADDPSDYASQRKTLEELRRDLDEVLAEAAALESKDGDADPEALAGFLFRLEVYLDDEHAIWNRSAAAEHRQPTV